MKNIVYALHFIMIWVIVYTMYVASTGTTALIVQPIFSIAFSALVAGIAILFEMQKHNDLKLW